MARRPFVLLLLAALTACPLPVSPRPPPEGPAPPEPTPPVQADAVRKGLRVSSVRAPTPTVYNAAALGLGRRSVTIRLTNTGETPARLGQVRASFTSTRNGVQFA